MRLSTRTNLRIDELAALCGRLVEFAVSHNSFSISGYQKPFVITRIIQKFLHWCADPLSGG